MEGAEECLGSSSSALSWALGTREQWECESHSELDACDTCTFLYQSQRSSKQDLFLNTSVESLV